MAEFFGLLFQFYGSLLSLLSSFGFVFNGVTVSILSLLVAALVLSLTVSAFWRSPKA